MGERFVVLGIARARSAWFASVAAWANTAVVPIDFLKCLTIEELIARIRRSAISAVLVDASIAGIERNLFEIARDAGVPVIVVDAPRVERDWTSFGAAAVVSPDFDADGLVRLLDLHATPIPAASLDVSPSGAGPALEPRSIGDGGYEGQLVAVCGARGSGTSTVAMAIAQGLASRPANRGSVVLADLALDADQALYHDAHDVVPGLHELVDAHRVGRPDADAVREMLFDVAPRRYQLLLGLRRQRVWTALTTAGIARSLSGLRSASRWVIADVTAEFDGEPDTGSIDLEERNALARTAVSNATCVVVVGDPGLRGLRALARICRELVDLGVDRSRVLPVVNRFSGPRARRSAIHDALSTLGLGDCTAMAAALLVPDRREIETCHANVGPLPERLVGPLAGAVEAVCTRVAEREPEPSGESIEAAPAA